MRGETEAQRDQATCSIRPYSQGARELGLKAVVTAGSCSLSLGTLTSLLQFVSICCIPVYTVGTNKWKTDGANVAGG